MRKILYLIVVMISLLSSTGVVFAVGSVNVTITAIPTFVAITNSPDTWIINGITGNSMISPDTVYYSNPLGDTAVPGATVNDSVCRFTVTNASSSIPLDLTVNFGNFSNGDASTNSNTGGNGATSFGVYTWYSGMTYSNKVVANVSGSAVLYNEWTGVTLKWGAEIETQSNAWTTGDPMTADMIITATAD